MVLSRSRPGDLRADTVREAGRELERLTWKLADSSWTSPALYPMVWSVTRSSASSPSLSSASIVCRVRKPSLVSSPYTRGKFSTTTPHSSSLTSSPLVLQLNKLNSVLQTMCHKIRNLMVK